MVVVSGRLRVVRLVAVCVAFILAVTIFPSLGFSDKAEVRADQQEGLCQDDNGDWKYYFGGKAQVGWQRIKNKDGNIYWHHFDSNGVMEIGWQKILQKDNKEYWFYFGASANDGRMKIGWQKIKQSNGKYYWYYFGATPDDGRMKIGWQRIKQSDGKLYWYYFGKGENDGKMKIGFQKIKQSDGKFYRYYFGNSANDGKMKLGWQRIKHSNGKFYWYYFGTGANDGKMRLGWQKIKQTDGKFYWYYFGSAATDGKMKISWKIIGGKKYYFGSKASDGRRRSGWHTIGGKRYYFLSNGVLSTSITLSKTSCSTHSGSKFTLTTNHAKGKVTWSSSNPSVASVSASGVVTANDGGTAVITAKSKTNSTYAKCKVSVNPYVKAASIRVSPTALTVYPGSPKDLDYYLTAPKGITRPANDVVTWTSSNTAVATVNAAGLVTGIRYGTATITARTEGGLTASAKVTVRTIWTSLSSVQLTPGTYIYSQVKPYGTTIAKYTSSNSAIASVSQTGVISASLRNKSTGNAVTGTAKITAVTADGDSVTISVNVVNDPTIIDISVWQDTINWAAASKSVDLAIVRVSDGARSKDEGYTDRLYNSYTADCKKYGVPFGAYTYARYKTKKQAEQEATYFYKKAIADGRKPAFFVVDCEESYINRANTEAFIAKLRSLAGKRVKVGIYAAHHLYEKMNLNLTTDVKNSKTPDFVWIPRYSYTNNGSIVGVPMPNYYCDMWQYSSGGHIPGINGNVDMNTIYSIDGNKLSNKSNFNLGWLKTP